MNIKKLQQIVSEEKYSRKNIYKELEEYVGMTMLGTITKIVNQHTIVPLEESEDLDSHSDLALTLGTIILTMEKTELLTVMASKVANGIKHMSRIEAVCEGAKLLTEIVKHTDYLKLTVRGEGHIVALRQYKPNEEIHDIISRIECLPPMLVMPKEVTNNHMSGHITINKPLLLTKHIIHNEHQNYHFINTMNSTALGVNMCIAEMVEEPNKDKQVDSNFKLLTKLSTKTYGYILENDNVCYLTHNYDTRGRFYPDNWMFNYQGSDYKKAIVCLAKKEIIK